MKVDFTTIDQLRTIFTSEQFYLTGSLVANILGVATKEPRDIDIVLVNPTNETINKLKEFQEKYPRKGKREYEKSNLYQINYNNLNIDLFIEANKIDEKLTFNGFIIAPINEMVKEKKSYRSPKHIMQLMNWRNNIISDDEFNQSAKTL